MTQGHDFLRSDDLDCVPSIPKDDFLSARQRVISAFSAPRGTPQPLVALLPSFAHGCLPRVRLTRGPASLTSASNSCRVGAVVTTLRSTVPARARLPMSGVGRNAKTTTSTLAGFDQDAQEELACANNFCTTVRSLAKLGMGHAVMTGGFLSRAIKAAAGAEGQELRTSALGFLASVLTPLATSGAGGLALASGGVAVSFCPLPLDCFGDLGQRGLKGIGLDKYATLPDLSVKDLERGILVATFVQGSLGLLRICLGDVFSGSYTLLLATLGYNARHPGPASNWLKTYVLITFINGTMGGIDIIQHMLLNDFPVVMLGLPLSVNLMHAVQLSVPGVSFLGAYCGWQHIKMQRKVQMEAYQENLLMMMAQTPWPPPQPPPFMIPGMPGMPGGPMLENGQGGMPFGQLPGAPMGPRGAPCPPQMQQKLATVEEVETEEVVP